MSRRRQSAAAPQEALVWLRSLMVDDDEVKLDPTLRKLCLETCAVLACFPLRDLNGPSGLISRKDLEKAIPEDEDRVPLPRFPGEPVLWALTLACRTEGLRLLGSLPRMWEARQRNPVEPLPVIQRVYDEFLLGNQAAASSDDTETLEAAIQVISWLATVTKDLPDLKTVERQLSRRRLLRPMERLTRGFMGRTTDLKALRGFVGVLEPENSMEAAVRFLRDFFSREQREPLFVQGIGGLGKSTLLAEFIRQHENSPVPFPYVYLDFDNPRLSVSDLSTIVDEMSVQLAAQYPGSNWDDVRDSVRRSSAVVVASDHGTGGGGIHTLSAAGTADNEQLRSETAEMAAEAVANTLKRVMETSSIEKVMRISEYLPFLIVLDTFEEVQKRGIELASVLWAFLGALQNQFPRTRILGAGRAEVKEFVVNGRSARLYPLKDFDETAAIAMLAANGVEDRTLAATLFRQVGGNPLSLKLVAQVARTEGAGKSGIEGLKTTSFLVFSAAETVVQGMLYRRILMRIPGDDLQKLAHPGLVVRRLTADIIQKVLAVPCGLGEITPVEADRLFQALAKQVDLVTQEPDGALRHQQEIRRVMLKLLDQERHEQVQAIHQAAYNYYLPRPDSVSIVERLYHALQLCMDEKEISAISTPDAAEALLASIEELPPGSQLLLYLLNNKTPPDSLRSLADLDQWDRSVEQKARQEIRYGRYASASKLLAERKERTLGSGLYAVAALISMREGKYTEALTQIETGIDSVRQVNYLALGGNVKR